MIRRLILGIVGIVLVVIVIVLVRTLSLEPRWADVPPVDDIRIDEMAAAERLSESVTYATLSHSLESRRRRGVPRPARLPCAELSRGP